MSAYTHHRCQKIAANIINFIKYTTPEFKLDICWKNIRLSNFFSPKLKLHVPLEEKMAQFIILIVTVHLKLLHTLANQNVNYIGVFTNIIVSKIPQFMFTFKNVMNINLNYHLNMGCHLHPQNVENLSKRVSNHYALVHQTILKEHDWKL